MQNKTILITGINKGIGKGLATTYTALGYRVIGTTRLKQQIEGVFKTYQLDVTDNDNIKQLTNQLIKDAITIDILINNAGIGSDYDDNLSKEENFELRFKTHLFGTFYFTESILPLINSQGKIINISSRLASFEEIDHKMKYDLSLNKMAYIMSKSSLNMYTKLLANRLHEQEITVLSIHPGWVKTSLSKTNEKAPLTIKESVNGIVKLVEEPKPSGTFWDAERQRQLNW